MKYLTRPLKKAAFSIGVLTLAALRTMPAQTDAPTNQTAANRAETILHADTEFARLADKEGAGKAFDTYLASDAVSPMAELEQPADRTAIVARMKRLDENGLKLVWAPIRGDLASSGDFGYTYGRWSVTKKEGGDALLHGYYTSIWKKQADGAWKAVFDMGNETAPSTN